MALIEITLILLALVGNASTLFVPDTDGTVVEITGDDTTKEFILASPIPFAGQGNVDTNVANLWVSRFNSFLVTFFL